MKEIVIETTIVTMEKMSEMFDIDMDEDEVSETLLISTD